MDILSLANTEFLVASAIGILTAAGMYLVMRMRTFPVIM
ncbi:MAG: Na+/H+ antiporter subunit C, partial [Paracoccaceae bacterium]|nr:Na+/H+ antiporter subunit C [Paracoccaceae bacterium]